MRRRFLPSVSFILLAILLFSVTSSASEDVFSLRFGPQDLIFEKVKNWDRVKLVEGRLSGEPGTPLLPVRFVQIAIPADLEVEGVEVISSEYEELPGSYQIYPAQPFFPLSSFPGNEEVEFVEPEASVYGSSSEYPGRLAEVTNNGFLGGQHIAGVALHPLQYIPAEGKLILYSGIQFKLIFKPTSHFPAPVNRRSAEGTRFYSDLARTAVINPEEVQADTRGFLPQDEEIDYLIITDLSFVWAFLELADWKTRKGISTEIKDVAWVLSNYPGYDDAEKVRNCIRDYYANHGTRWVLLGGDTDIVPHRSARVQAGGYDELIPCDLYYSDLDSNWDADGDHTYGEYEDSVDMYPEVFVGRVPCSDMFQAQTFVNKCLSYETYPPIDYQTKILYAAEELWHGTDGAECKNYIDSSFVPGYFQTTKLYETSGNLNWTNFRDGLNQGQNIINHNGHGNTNLISIGPDVWTNSDMDNLTNGPRFSLFYTFACITAAIDGDCLGEHFVNNPDGGGFAYCGNTRYGWGLPGYPLQGPGAEFDIEFFRVLFDSSAYQVGKTLGDSKIPFIPISQDPSGGGPYYRWTMFTLLLLGDPTLELWTDTPAELAVDHGEFFPAGMTYFEVAVTQDDALTSCVKDGEILGTALSSDGMATVYFVSPLEDLGTMHVTVTKHDYLPYHDSVMVIPPEGPYVIYSAHLTDDSGGNDNGVVNPAETISMSIQVKNIGLEDAQGVSAVLRESDSYVVVTDSVESFGDIDSGMAAQSLGSYVFEVDASCPDSHLVEFNLEATDGQSYWVTRFFQMVVEPDVVITASPDTTIIEPGDSALIQIVFTPLGGFNLQLNLDHSSLPPEVSGFFDPDDLIPPGSSWLRLGTSPDVYPGLYPITVSGTAGEFAFEKEVVLGVVSPPYSGSVWHVSNAGHDPVGNGSEEFPFGTIQKGINSSATGDTVLVETGLYVENINFMGKATLVGSHYILDGSEATIESTVIDGNNSGTVVTFDSGEDSNSVIRGFTITGGYAAYGGGIHCHGSSPTITENFIVENECYTNAGGPAIYCGYRSDAKILGNLVADCSGPAAVFVHFESEAQVINNTVCDNSWGGLSVTANSAACVRNNVVCNNNLYGIHGWDLSSEDISYNDVYGHENDYWGDLADQTGINGNISDDPLFVDPSTDNYHLAPGSPCLNAGDPDDWVPSGGGAAVDMGAFETMVDGPWVRRLSHQIDDSGGNNNGVLNPGDLVSLPITVRNTGTETAFGVTGTLSEDSDFITVTDNTQYFGDLEPDQIVTGSGPYVLEIDPSCPDSQLVTFELELTDGNLSWSSYFYEMVADTDFALSASRDTVMVWRGSYGLVEVVVASLGAFASQVGMIHSELPTGVTAEFNPDQLVPTDTSGFTISTTFEAPCGVYPVTITAVGGGITHQEPIHYRIISGGDCNEDGAVDIGDVVFMLNYLFKGGPAPNPPEVGDVNRDGGVNIADIVFLINYLYRDGEPPPGSGNKGFPSGTHKKVRGGAPAGLVWSGGRESVADLGAAEVVVKGRFEVDVAGVQLAIEYDPKSSATAPTVSTPLQGLQVFSSGKNGLIRAGIVDLTGESYIPAGLEIELLVLKAEGTSLPDLRIREALVAGRTGSTIPVKIVTDEEKEATRPERFALFQNYPNPFNPQTQIRYALPQECEVKVTIYNLLGQTVRVLVDERQDAGCRRVHWDGKDEQGTDVASGVYFYKIEAGDFVDAKKMLLLK